MRIIKLLVLSVALAFAADSVKYSYDAEGRLILADYGARGSIAYTYDSAGNLLKRVVTPPAPPTQPQGKPQKTKAGESAKPAKSPARNK